MLVVALQEVLTLHLPRTRVLCQIDLDKSQLGGGVEGRREGGRKGGGREGREGVEGRREGERGKEWREGGRGGREGGREGGVEGGMEGGREGGGGGRERELNCGNTNDSLTVRVTCAITPMTDGQVERYSLSVKTYKYM